jgi:carbonic anhydrase
MANVLDEVLAANQTYAAEFGERGRLPVPPARRFATCMDARLDPAKFAGLKEGDAHVIRNADASDDAIRSLIISHTQAALALMSGL